MRIFTICALILSALISQARTIIGTIVDETNSPASFVNVILMRDSTFIDGITTNDNGVFIFDNADSLANNIKVIMFGYETKLLPIPSDNCFSTITLRPTSIVLGEMIVKGDMPSTRIKGNAFVTQVEHKVLATVGNAKDVLNNIPMITGSNGNFNVFGRGEATVYINGRIVRNSDEIEQLASNEIKEVQVIPNPGAQYGANTNAVIRIVTKKNDGEGFSISAYTNNMYNHRFITKEQLDVKYRNGGLEVFGMGFFIGGKSIQNECASTTRYGQAPIEMISNQSGSTTQTNYTGKVGLSYQLENNHSIGAYYEQNYNNEHTYGCLLNNISENGKSLGASMSNILGSSITRPGHNTNIYYNGTVGKFAFEVNGDYMSATERDYSWQHEESLITKTSNITTFNTTHNRLLAEKATMTYGMSKGSLMVGEEYTYSRSQNDFRNPENILTSEISDVRETNLGIFFEGNRTYGNFSVSAGLRYERIKSDYLLNDTLEVGQSKFYCNIFPSANITYTPGSSKLSLSYSNRTTRPSYRNLSGNYFYVNSMFYTRGNPYLKPTKRHDFTVQATWKYFMLSAQYTYSKDVILQTFQPYNDNERISVFTITNTPNQKLLSLYLNASPQFGAYHPSLSFGLQKQWFGSNFCEQYLEFNYPIFTLQMQNSVILPKNWFIEASIWWRSRGDWKNWSYTHPQSTINLRAYKILFNKALTVFLGINDILNGMQYHAVIKSGNVKMQSSINNYSRNVELTLRYNFNTSNSRYKGSGAGGVEKARF